ncbi:MAG: hypothetical protein ACRDU8_10440 [Egibacteraceae bacterium]
MFRRKAIPQRLHPAYDAFTAQAERVQAARKALLSCLPVGRVEPAPVSVGLDVLRDEVTAVAEAMEDWRVGEVDEQWRRCRVAIDEALEAVPRARKLAEATAELEELLGAVSDVVEPLGNAWRAAEQRWRALRERV